MKSIVKKARIVLLILSVCLIGCSKINTEDEILYSNLTDFASQREVADILESHGVSKNQTNTLISWVDDFNSRTESKVLTTGFKPMKKGVVDYSKVMVEEKESENGYLYPEVNCRLTSYLLMKNMISTNTKKIKDDTILMFDLETINKVEQFELSRREREDYISLFNWIPLDGAKTLKEHEDAIKNAWADREIKINADGISLVNVYLHSQFDNVRFVGHTGVLVEGKDNLLFVEKYSPLAPFQATKFSDREELKQYLLNRNDLYGEKTELEPIIMENDKIL